MNNYTEIKNVLIVSLILIFSYAQAAPVDHSIISFRGGLSDDLSRNETFAAMILVDLNTGESALGVQVFMTNLDEGGVSSAVVDGQGYCSFESLDKGNYRLSVDLEGFNYYQIDTLIVQDYWAWEVNLVEALCPPVNLAVNVECESLILNWESPVDCFDGMEEPLRSFDAYNVYLNGQLYAEGVGENTFTITDLDGGIYQCAVAAVYDSGESELVTDTFTVPYYRAELEGTIQLWNDILLEWEMPEVESLEMEDELELLGFKISRLYYPIGVYDVLEPCSMIFSYPATDVVNVELSANVETVKVLNAIGQVVYAATVNGGTHVINTTDFASGAYVIQTVSNGGDVQNHKVVITK